MHEQGKAREQRLAYEKLLYRYSTALECGDLDTIISILHLAESDSHLEQLIIETHEEGYLQEEAMLGQDKTNYQAAPSRFSAIVPDQSSRLSVSSKPINKPDRSYKRWLRFVESVAAVLVVAALVMGAQLLFVSHKTNLPKTVGTREGTIQQPEDIVVLISGGVDSTYDDTITARNARTGAFLWKYVLGKPVETYVPIGLVVQSSTVYVAFNNHVQAFQLKDGKLLWQTTLGTARSGIVTNDNPPSLVVDRGLVYASGYVSGNLYTLDAKTGKIIWHYDVSRPPTLLAVSNGIAYVIAYNDNSDQNAIKALNGTDGRELWHYNTTMPLTATIANNTLFAQAAESLQNDLYGSHKEQKPLIALDATSGKPLWSVIAPANAPSPLAVAQGVLVLFNSSNFCGYRISDGSQAWCAQSPIMGLNGTGPLGAHGLIYGIYGSSSSVGTSLETIDPRTGKVAWSKDIGAYLSGDPSIIALGDDLLLLNNWLVVQRTDGKVLEQLPDNFIVTAAGS